MTSVIQVKRRITAGTGGAPTGGAEGELALNFVKGTPGGKPELWANGGAVNGWCQVNPDVTVSVASVQLPGGTTGSATGIGAAWTALTPKPTDPITIAKFAGTAYVKTGVGNSDGDWAALGAATSFASKVEIDTGTDTSKAINPAGLRGSSRSAPSGATPTGPTAADVDQLVRLNAAGGIDDRFVPKAPNADVLAGTATNEFITPAGLQSRIVTAPNATPAADLNKIPVLDNTGKIPVGFMPITGLSFAGSLDPTAASPAPPAPSALTNGAFYSVAKAGAIDATWKAKFVKADLTNVNAGDFMVWDAALGKFHHIANAIDMSAYVPLLGTNTMSGSINWGGAVNSKKGTIILGGKGGTIDAIVVDGGTY